MNEWMNEWILRHKTFLSLTKLNKMYCQRSQLPKYLEEFYRSLTFSSQEFVVNLQNVEMHVFTCRWIHILMGWWKLSRMAIFDKAEVGSTRGESRQQNASSPHKNSRVCNKIHWVFQNILKTEIKLVLL